MLAALTSAAWRDEDLFLDMLDLVLRISQFIPNVKKLTIALEVGASVWTVTPDGKGLMRRNSPTTTAVYSMATSPEDAASDELASAWAHVYGRHPNPSDAWDHSIKAVEEQLKPIVIPNKITATLGDIVGMLNSQGQLWQLVLYGNDGSQSVATLVSMLRLMWPNPDRHGGETKRSPSLAEAQTVVQLAVTIIQWARSGVLSKRS